MASATFETEIAVGTTEALERSFRNIKELSPDNVQTLMLSGDFVHNLFKKGRQQIENDLRRGTDARAFVATYEGLVSFLDVVKARVERILQQEREDYPPALTAELISKYESLAAELASFRKLLLDALATAEKPSRRIDWHRVQEAEAAYSRGETKPFRKIAGTRQRD